MTGSQIQDLLREAYARRAANDADGLLELLGPGASYRVVGEAAHCRAVATHAGDALKPAFDLLCQTFKAGSFDVVSMCVDGDRAAVHLKIALTFTPTGAPVSSELAHFWTFRDGKVVEIVEFLDTAMVNALAAA